MWARATRSHVPWRRFLCVTLPLACSLPMINMHVHGHGHGHNPAPHQLPQQPQPLGQVQVPHAARTSAPVDITGIESTKQLYGTRSSTPPAPFDQPAALTVLRGGVIQNPTGSKYDSTPLSRDLILSGPKIFAITSSNETNTLIDAIQHTKIAYIDVDVSGCTLIPGLVDVHVHAAGGGGEQGFASRTPESTLHELIDAGITTIVGISGTDSVARNPVTLLAKLRGLERDGLNTYMWTGAYHVPVPTATKNVQDDITLIDKVLGVGELALSDHRSSWPSYDELVRIVSDARVAGLLSSKAGLVHFHMGSAPSGLDPLWAIVNHTSIPITQMYPTHISSRGPGLIAEAVKWIAAGGVVDLTADATVHETTTCDTLTAWKQRGTVDLSHVSVSSDAYGSLPVFDSAGRLISYDVGHPSVTLRTIQTLVHQYNWELADALQFSTINPSRILSLPRGQLHVGGLADVVVLNEKLQPQYVFSQGQIMKTPKWTKHGMFEK